MLTGPQKWNLAQYELGVYDDIVLSELIRRGALSIQEEAGLIVDGLAGPNTIKAINELFVHEESPKIRIPTRKTADIESVYGKFSYQDIKEKPGSILIEKSWTRKNHPKLSWVKRRVWRLLSRYRSVV